ncbi:hypothetical protein HDV00_010748 [Rhizophlyctis rosea]|nr:hypothetical protein HDV00_010748 [Rhizophlyctis rosea]
MAFKVRGRLTAKEERSNALDAQLDARWERTRWLLALSYWLHISTNSFQNAKTLPNVTTLADIPVIISPEKHPLTALFAHYAQATYSTFLLLQVHFNFITKRWAGQYRFCAIVMAICCIVHTGLWVSHSGSLSVWKRSPFALLDRAVDISAGWQAVRYPGVDQNEVAVDVEKEHPE